MGSDVVKSAQDVIDYLGSAIRDARDEQFIGILLNKKNEVIEIARFGEGSADRVTLNPRAIIESCISHGASKIILVHNHPSGSVEPGPKDLQLTGKIREGLKFIEVEMLDHIIVGGNGHYSMKTSGDLDSM